MMGVCIIMTDISDTMLRKVGMMIVSLKSNTARRTGYGKRNN